MDEPKDGVGGKYKAYDANPIPMEAEVSSSIGIISLWISDLLFSGEKIYIFSAAKC